MSQVTFSQDLGILKAGSDYKGFLRQSNRSLDYLLCFGKINISYNQIILVPFEWPLT